MNASVDWRQMPTRQALTTRFLDFWLLGGARCWCGSPWWLASGFRSAFGMDQQFRNLTFTALSLALILNYPHFLMSYKFAYGRGLRFVFKHWWQLIAVPIGLIGLLPRRILLRPAGEPLDARLARIGGLYPWGVNSRVLAGPRLGDLLFGRLQPDDFDNRLALHDAGVRLHDGVHALRRLHADARQRRITKARLAQHLDHERRREQPSRRVSEHSAGSAIRPRSA